MIQSLKGEFHCISSDFYYHCSYHRKEPKLMTTKLHEDTNKGVHIKELTEKERMHTEEKEKLESECRALKSNNVTYLVCHNYCDLNYIIIRVALEEEHSKEICTLQEKISTLSVQLLQKNDIIKSLKGGFHCISSDFYYHCSYCRKRTKTDDNKIA